MANSGYTNNVRDFIYLFIKGIYIAQVRKGNKCARQRLLLQRWRHLLCGVTSGSKDGKLTPDAANEWRKTDSPNFFQINDHKSGNENVCWMIEPDQPDAACRNKSSLFWLPPFWASVKLLHCIAFLASMSTQPCIPPAPELPLNRVSDYQLRLV